MVKKSNGLLPKRSVKDKAISSRFKIWFTHKYCPDKTTLEERSAFSVVFIRCLGCPFVFLFSENCPLLLCIKKKPEASRIWFLV